MRAMTMVFVLALVLPVPHAEAQGQGRARGRSTIRFVEMDRNGDGIVTREEWRGSDRAFRAQDWNNDGRLSGDELRPGAQPNRRPADQDAAPRDHDQAMADWTEQGFVGLDRNEDGRISRDEWRFDDASFVVSDVNRNGALSRAEFLGRDTRDSGDAGDHFRIHDRNNDGRVSREEWQGAAALFEALDGNQDRMLSGTELDPTPTPQLFTRLDRNRDSSLARSEWPWSSASFDTRDANRDGHLTRAELGESPREDRSPGYRAGYDRGMVDGRTAGREDRERNQGWDLDGQRELEVADAGYEGRMGVRADYQAGYREAFRVGYREGFGR